MIVWTDIESTSLDERDGHLLEVAIIATDDNLVERAHTSVVINPVGVDIDDVKMPMVVREMHEKSGLIADIKAGRGLELADAAALLSGWLTAVFIQLEDLRKIPLAGSTIAFDRRWLRHHMASIEKLFLHRSIDVSSMNELAERWAPMAHNNRPKQDRGVSHRALDDIRHSINVLRHYRECAFVGGCK